MNKCAFTSSEVSMCDRKLLSGSVWLRYSCHIFFTISTKPAASSKSAVLVRCSVVSLLRRLFMSWRSCSVSCAHTSNTAKSRVPSLKLIDAIEAGSYPTRSRAEFRGGPRRPGPQASHHRRAFHQTAHILFLANESADDFFLDVLLQFASV